MEGETTLKSLIAVVIATAMLLPSVSADTFLVGGSTGWDLATNITQWSASYPIFVINDTLLFNYTPAHDVIQVSQAGFASCDTSSAIAAYNTGYSLVNLTEPGFTYFVCGRSDHCTLGLKLQVLVLDSAQVQPPSSNYPDNRNGSDDTPDSSSIDRTACLIWRTNLVLSLFWFVLILAGSFWYLLDVHPLGHAAPLPPYHVTDFPRPRIDPTVKYAEL